MNNAILIKDQQFYISGEELFVLGAELHYFRVPKHLWKDRLLKIKDAGCNLVSTYIPWSVHEPVEGNIDLEGKTRPEKDLKTFLELAKEMGFLVLVRPGPYVMSEIKGHGLPDWLFKNYPETIAKRIDGSNHTIVSYLNDTYLKQVEKWYQAVFELVTPLQITNGGNIILVQLDNEVGMFPWVMNHPDYSDFILERFTHYLEDKYTIQSFKQLFQTEEIRDFVFTYLKNPQKENAIPIMNEFMLFHREYFRDYVIALKKIAEKYGMNVPIVVNVHGFHQIDYAKRGLQYPIGLSQLLKTTEIDNMLLAGDYYVGNIVPDNYFDVILANAFTKAIEPKNQPLFSAEFQSGFQVGVPRLQPTTTDLKSRICIGNGMNAINYYMLVGGENYEGIGLMGRRHDWQAPIGMDGSLRPHYYVISHLSHVLKAYGSALTSSKHEVSTHLAFDPDYFMTEYDHTYTKPFKQELQRMREVILFNGIGKALSFLNITFDGYNLLEDGDININQVPTLWVFSTGYMNEKNQQKLVHYVQNGGKLIISPYLPTLDLNQRPCTVLIDAFDLKIKDRKDWQTVNVGDVDNIVCFYTEAYPVDDGFSKREQTNEVVGYSKQVGRGQVVIFGAGILSEHDYKIEAYGNVAKELGLESIVKTDEWVTVSVRVGKRGTFIFINNLDEYDKISTFTYKNNLLFDGKPLTMPMRKGVILPIDWMVTNHILVKYSTAEFVSVQEDLDKVTLKAKTLGEEWILMETSYQLEANHGTVIPLKQNLYKVISPSKGILELTLRK